MSTGPNEPTGDQREAPVIITQSALDETGNPPHDSDPMRDLYVEQVHREETQEGGLTTAQVAKRLGIKPSTWRSLVTRGSAPQPSGYYDGRTPYWMPVAVDTWRAIHPTRK